MKKTLHLGLLTTWLTLATLVLAHFWLAYPDMGPQVPPSVAEWLVQLYHSKDGEDLADLEDLFAIAVSFFIVAIFTITAYFAWWRYLKGRSAASTAD
jgi:hypothetical protein